MALEERPRRMRDPYELGDRQRPEYVARRDAVNAELAALAPGPIPDLDQARKVLDDFSIFWARETDPAAKRRAHLRARMARRPARRRGAAQGPVRPVLRRPSRARTRPRTSRNRVCK
ncbi:MAG TPA: hypothetical protein VNX67_03475 [Solirubrobacteraceae bacterium]|jgi:hypothetical protein|nr:hypothetical protein [Solirubrobacteraceae bacterium]